MSRFAVLALLVALPVAARAQDSDAKKMAQAILDKGADLFDNRDAAAMAATYTEDGRVLWIERDKDTGVSKVAVKDGRGEIESLYRGMFDNQSGKTTSKNVVEYARLVAPDLMVIHGTFQPDTARESKYPFVQVRTKSGGRWLITTLEFFAIDQGL